jgi:hypothetical protein
MIQTPTKLLPLSDRSVKYVINISTKKPVMSHSGINVCMVDKNGEAVLKRLSTLDMNRSIEFRGPELDGLVNVMVSPESDVLHLDGLSLEIDGETYDFSYDGVVGGGNGDAAVFVHKTLNGVDMKPIYDAEYASLKESVLKNTMEYTLTGGIVIAFVCDLDKGYAFSLGGFIGFLYVLLLEQGIDSVGDPKTQILSSSVLRLGAVFGLAAAIVSHYHESISAENSYIVLGLLGFLTQRIAVIRSYMNIPKDPKDPIDPKNDIRL